MDQHSAPAQTQKLYDLLDDLQTKKLKGELVTDADVEPAIQLIKAAVNPNGRVGYRSLRMMSIRIGNQRLIEFFGSRLTEPYSPAELGSVADYKQLASSLPQYAPDPSNPLADLFMPMSASGGSAASGGTDRDRKDRESDDHKQAAYSSSSAGVAADSTPLGLDGLARAISSSSVVSRATRPGEGKFGYKHSFLSTSTSSAGSFFAKFLHVLQKDAKTPAPGSTVQGSPLVSFQGSSGAFWENEFWPKVAEHLTPQDMVALIETSKTFAAMRIPLLWAAAACNPKFPLHFVLINYFKQLKPGKN